MQNTPDLEFTLHGPPAVGAVGIRLRRFGERWVASSAAGGGVGMGLTARAALSAAIEPFGGPAVRHLMADLSLLGPSLAVVAAERDSLIGA